MAPPSLPLRPPAEHRPGPQQKPRATPRGITDPGRPRRLAQAESGHRQAALRRRRIIAIALPHLEAQQRLRREGLTGLDAPFAVVRPSGNALRLCSVNAAAAEAGLMPGQGLADARAICPGLLTRPMLPDQVAAFRQALIRWADRFSPLVGEEENGALIADATGGAHLWGGEAGMLAALREGLAGLGLTARVAIADTKGAAWALAEFGQEPLAIAPPGSTRSAIGELPVAALRLPSATAEALTATGLGRVEQIARIPRAQLARRFGTATLRRLDQALGAEPDPVEPRRPLPVFSARLSLPEPIGLLDDLKAGLARLLDRLCAQLEAHGRGARTLRLVARRADGGTARADLQLARPLRDAARLAALFAPKLEGIEAGHGIDALRLIAPQTEVLVPTQLRTGRQSESDQLADLITRLGNRIGFDRVTRLLPADSHMPERAFTTAAAAYAEPARWPRRSTAPSPIVLFAPEPVMPTAPGTPPAGFRWRGRDWQVARADGPCRIAPEWWWDDPAWASGLRDYWRVETTAGPRLWLFHTPANPTPTGARPAWHAHGLFA